MTGIIILSVAMVLMCINCILLTRRINALEDEIDTSNTILALHVLGRIEVTEREDGTFEVSEKE